MTENLKQKLKHCSVGLFFAGMALTGSISILRKAQPIQIKFCVMYSQQLKQASTQLMYMTYIQRMYSHLYLKLYIPMTIWQDQQN